MNTEGFLRVDMLLVMVDSNCVKVLFFPGIPLLYSA
jgi:hypothetical protein